LKGAVVAIGGEILQGVIQDTNSFYCNGILVELGFSPVVNMVVGDSVEEIMGVLDFACSKASLILVSGGLGPTEDDVTREALARFCGVPLEFHEEVWRWIGERLRSRKTALREDHKIQAYFPKGATLFPNHNGTAWGFAVFKEEAWIVVLPGIPGELKLLMVEEVNPFVRNRFSHSGDTKSIVLKSFGLKESEVNALLKPFMKAHPGQIGLMVRDYGEVHVRIVGAVSLVEELACQVQKALGDHVYGGGDETLESVVGGLLKGQRLTISTAESCTGGMLAHTITNVSGSSDYFIGGFVTYTNEAKRRFLGVPKDVLEQYDAVSEETAHHMVKGLVERTGSSVGIAVTGVAGPMGGTAEKPVGLVYIGYSFLGDIEVERHLFHGDRLGIKTMAVKTALDKVRGRFVERGMV